MKKILVFMMAMIATVSMMAQTVEKSKLTDNTSVTVKGGVSALMHPGCNGYENLGHTLQASAGLNLEKWVTPTFGLGLDGTVGFTNGSRVGLYQSKNWVNYVSVMAQGKVNWTNLLLGYKGAPRKFEVVTAAGIGWVHGFYQGTEFPGVGYMSDQDDLGTKFSAELKYNVTPRLALVASPYLAYRLTNGLPTQECGTKHMNRQPRFDSRAAWYGLEVGVSYRLGKTFTLCPYKYTQADVDALNGQINDLREELARKPKVVEKVVEKVKKVTVATDANQYVVFFDLASSELTPTAREVLDKITVSKVRLVVGSASPEGSKGFNEKLSTDRAQAVKSYLEGKGVKVSEAVGVGTELNSRVAVVTVE